MENEMRYRKVRSQVQKRERFDRRPAGVYMAAKAGGLNAS